MNTNKLANTDRCFTALDEGDLDLVAGGGVGAAAIAQAASAGSPFALKQGGHLGAVTSKLMETLTTLPGNDGAHGGALDAIIHSSGTSATSTSLDSPSAALPAASTVTLGDHSNGYQAIVSSMGLDVDAQSADSGGCHHHCEDQG